MALRCCKPLRCVVLVSELRLALDGTEHQFVGLPGLDPVLAQNGRSYGARRAESRPSRMYRKTSAVVLLGAVGPFSDPVVLSHQS